MSHHLKSEICFIHIRPRSGLIVVFSYTELTHVFWKIKPPVLFLFIEPESNHCLPFPQTFVDLNYLTWIEVTNSRSKGNRLSFQQLQVHWKYFPLSLNFTSVLFKLPFFIYFFGWPFPDICDSLVPFIYFFGRFCSFSNFFLEGIALFWLFWQALPFFDIFWAGIIPFWYFLAGIVPF